MKILREYIAIAPSISEAMLLILYSQPFRSLFARFRISILNTFNSRVRWPSAAI